MLHIALLYLLLHFHFMRFRISFMVTFFDTSFFISPHMLCLSCPYGFQLYAHWYLAYIHFTALVHVSTVSVYILSFCHHCRSFISLLSHIFRIIDYCLLSGIDSATYISLFFSRREDSSITPIQSPSLPPSTGVWGGVPAVIKVGSIPIAGGCWWCIGVSLLAKGLPFAFVFWMLQVQVTLKDKCWKLIL